MTNPRHNLRDIYPPTGSEITAKSWLTEAPMRMLMNNLHPDVAENPHELVVYGGIGRAARDWALSRQAGRVRAPEIIWTETIPDVAYEDDAAQPELALDEVKGVLAARKASQDGSENDDDTPPKNKSLRAAE